MITGIVNADFEPIISLSIYGTDGKIYTQDAIVDTGFNGWLSLPPDLIARLNLRWKRRGKAILGDGSECIFNVYEASLSWDGNLIKRMFGKYKQAPVEKKLPRIVRLDKIQNLDSHRGSHDS